MDKMTNKIYDALNGQKNKKNWVAPSVILLDESIDSAGSHLFEDQAGGGIAHS